jgi:hypothetical protein
MIETIFILNKTTVLKLVFVLVLLAGIFGIPAVFEGASTQKNIARVLVFIIAGSLAFLLYREERKSKAS